MLFLRAPRRYSRALTLRPFPKRHGEDFATTICALMSSPWIIPMGLALLASISLTTSMPLNSSSMSGE